MDQIMREAGPHWDQLGDSQRDAYKDRAKAYKSSPKQHYGEKFTAQGTPYSLIEKEHQAKLKKQETIRKAIAEMIQTAAGNNVLEKMKVYFISFNHFCKTTAQVYVPAEMAIIRYNLELGVLDKLHQFVDPGKLPLGLAYEANLLSDETHRLPIPPDSMGENDFAVLLEKVLNFTDYENKKSKLFPLFTDAKEVPMVENILSQFADESKILYTFLVCPIGEFFFQLKRATESYGLDICTFPAKTVADILLKKDTYEYTSEIACEFHEKLGNPRYCALSRVVRWSYIISDSCCLDLSIDLIAGRHLPSNADTTFLCSDLSETGSKTSLSQTDRMSFVSSSDVTHLSMPKIQKIRSKSPFRGIEDDNGSIIYSSRAGTSKEVKKFDKCVVDKNISTNPFYSTDILGVPATKIPPVVSGVPASNTNYNPFSRQAKLEEVRQPREIGVVGHGRGALLGMTGPAGVVSSTVFRGVGRGSGLFSTVSSVGSTSSTNVVHGEDNVSEW